MLALIQGLGPKIFSLAVIGVHVRLLVVIPLFFACESFVAPRMANSWLAKVIFLLLAFSGPLFLFIPKLWYCRSTGLDEYMAMASRYVHAFDREWIRDENASGDSQLGTSDMQSLADLTNSVNVVRNMRLVHVGRRLTIETAACVIVPMLPLLLLKFPVDEIAKVLFRALAGL